MSSEQSLFTTSKCQITRARLVGRRRTLVEQKAKKKKSWRGTRTFIDAFFARRDCQQLWLHHWNFSSACGISMIYLVDRVLI
jgi:hypothetical protein